MNHREIEGIQSFGPVKSNDHLSLVVIDKNFFYGGIESGHLNKNKVNEEK